MTFGVETLWTVECLSPFALCLHQLQKYTIRQMYTYRPALHTPQVSCMLWTALEHSSRHTHTHGDAYPLAVKRTQRRSSTKIKASAPFNYPAWRTHLWRWKITKSRVWRWNKYHRGDGMQTGKTRDIPVNSAWQTPSVALHFIMCLWSRQVIDLSHESCLPNNGMKKTGTTVSLKCKVWKRFLPLTQRTNLKLLFTTCLWGCMMQNWIEVGQQTGGGGNEPPVLFLHAVPTKWAES